MTVTPMQQRSSARSGLVRRCLGATLWPTLRRVPVARVLLPVVLVLASGPAAFADWIASGSFHYTNRLYSSSGWTGTNVLPIRRADVQVYDLNTLAVLAEGATDETGAYSLLVLDGAVRDVGVRVLADSTRTPGLNVRVVDDQNSFAVYVFHDASSDVLAHAAHVDVDFGARVAPPAIGDPVTTDWSSQVFNTFDMAVLTADLVASLDGAWPASAVELRWSPGNGRTGSSYNGGSNAVSLADDDGYDDANILHELGHYVEDEFGRSRNTGGTHTSSDDDQDPRLAWSEGYATYISGLALDLVGAPQAHLYSDRNSFGSTGGFAYSYESATSGGATQERAVTSALYDLIDDAQTQDTSIGSDDDPLAGLGGSVWAVTTEMRARSLPTTNLEDFWRIWFELSLGHAADLVTIFAVHQIDFAPDPQEPNDRPEDATVLSVGATYLENTFYRMGPDATGDEDWFRFQAVTGSTYRIEVNGAADTIFGRPDPQMFVLDLAGQRVLAHADDPLDTVLNTQSSSTAQDMKETIPVVLWRADRTGPVHVLLRHATRGLNIMQYGTYRVRVQSVAAPVPEVTAVSGAPLRPGESYDLLVRGDNFAQGATVGSGSAGIATLEVAVLSPQVLWCRVAVAPWVAAGPYPISVTQPWGASATLVDAVSVALDAAPPVVITEVDLGGEDRVELRNLGTVPADLTGWQVIGRTTSATAANLVFEIPSFVLAPGASVIVTEAAGTDTATVLYDPGALVSWGWTNGGTGDVSLVDGAGRALDYVRFVQRFVTTHLAPVGTGMIWMQPEIQSPPTGFTLSRADTLGRQRTTHGLAPTLSTLPDDEAGRTNALDPWEDNDAPRRAPVLAGSGVLDDLAISPRPAGNEDLDWFGIALQAGETLAVRVSRAPGAGALRLDLFAPGEETTALATSASGAPEEQAILLPATTATHGGGVYRLRVAGVAGTTGAYTLRHWVVQDPTDCDASGIPDALELEFGLVEDCDGNGVPDACDLSAATHPDCNRNGVPDLCDIASGISLDADASGVPDECEIPEFMRGDCNSDGGFDIADAIRLLGYLFPGAQGGAALACSDACDANDDGVLNIADAIRILDGLFGVPAVPPPAPHPTCGRDSTDDTLDCELPVCP